MQDGLRLVAYNFLSGGSAKRAGQWSRVLRTLEPDVVFGEECRPTGDQLSLPTLGGDDAPSDDRPPPRNRWAWLLAHVSARISTSAPVAVGLCAGSRPRSLSLLPPGSWPSTAWGPDLHRSCTDTRRASSLYRSRAAPEPFALDGSLENAERWPASVRRIGSEPQSAGPKGSSAILVGSQSPAHAVSFKRRAPPFCFTG